MRVATGCTAYFDASGHPDAKVGAFLSSGFVSTDEKWLRFEEGWLALLDEYGISNPFHMAEFASGVGQYRSWAHDTAHRSEFYAKATRLLKRWTNKGFSQGIYLPDFDRMHREYGRAARLLRFGRSE